MGGLPAEIRFVQTGKRLDKITWNDRLYHHGRGGFRVLNDRQARLELLATGPLCTVVRVRARYCDGSGNWPASQPAVVYDWYYFKELPLIYVTATVNQAEPTTWHELHLLELHQPENELPNWAGGEPQKSGKFSGTRKSEPFSQWAAIHDSRNVIAMAGAGYMLIHDGLGSYGPYLRAGGAAAWSAWQGTSRHYSAWLLIGSSAEPVRWVRTIAGGPLPTNAHVAVSVRSLHERIAAAGGEAASQGLEQRWRASLADQLVRQGRFSSAVAMLEGKLPEGWQRLTAGELVMLIERSDGGVRLVSLYDQRTGRELAAASQPPLFQITLCKVQPEKWPADQSAKRSKQVHELQADELTAAAEAGWQQVTVERIEGRNGLRLRWDKPKEQRLAGLNVTAKVDGDNDARCLRWTIEVANGTKGWSLWRVAFPQLAVAEPGEQACALCPHGPGQVQPSAWSKPFRFVGRYPSGWATMQFFAAYAADGSCGMYFALHDPLASTKELELRSEPDRHALLMSFSHPVANMGRAGNGFSLSGTAVWQLFRGDWYDAACIYRHWVQAEAEWYPRIGPDGREDTPLWMRKLCLWALDGGAPKSCVPAVKLFAKRFEPPVGFHWYNWHKIPFDNDYPHYFPSKGGFADGVKELQGAGVYVMPYINGRLWDTRDRGKLARAAATKSERGEPYVEMYGSKESDGSPVRLAVMCPTTELWQSTVRGIVLRLFNEYGVKAVYIDQVAAAAPRLCFDPAHGHPLGGGHWWTVDGYWKMLAAIRAAKPADRVLTTECTGEPYIRCFDGYLSWDWQYDGQVPALPVIYSGAIQLFGRSYGGGPDKNLALRMKAGQQLVFGEQIGWLPPALAAEKENAEFLKQLVDLRRKLVRYFYAGQLLRPPKLLGEVPTVEADWQWQGKRIVRTDAVLTGARSLPQQRRAALIFVNVSDKLVIATLERDRQRYPWLTDASVLRVLGPAGSRADSEQKVQLSRPLSFPPRSAWAIELSTK